MWRASLLARLVICDSTERRRVLRSQGVLKYDIEAARLSKQGQGPEKGHSRTTELNSQDLLEQLPALQQLLYRLIGCRAEGVAKNNYLVQYARAQVLKESFKIDCAINDGIINLIDKFFEMPKHEALKALDVYKRAVHQAGNLSDFYESCQGLELARKFPVSHYQKTSELDEVEFSKYHSGVKRGDIVGICGYPEFELPPIHF
ncbi:putative clathrin assembly protein [Zea mays]|uniref:Putative clathrin assembly protein n=1 Tax=Zea mays TaxID=4577 RepID=A0A3L6FN90_MAIZE|nr:putative clathrin assembly protein [Zea mays]